MERLRVRLVGCLLAMLGIAAVASARAADEPVNVLELSIGPVVTASGEPGAGLAAAGAVQLTRVQSPDRPSSVLLLARYRSEPYEHQGFEGFHPYPGGVDGDGAQRGGSGDGRAQFIEVGVGLRSSGTRGSLTTFADVEAGAAAILYVSDGDKGDEGSLYVAFRAGSAWQAMRWLQATLTVAGRVYLGVQHASAQVALGIGHAF